MCNMFTPIVCVTKSCPLECTYCYVKNKNEEIIATSLLKRFFNSLFSINKTDRLNIIWHGGEPLIAGISFYTEMCNYIRSEFPHINVEHSVQTSGWLINKEWCKFFKEYNFKIGISLDGPQHVHDIHRRTRGNQSTYHQIFNNIKLLENFGLKCGFIVVVTNKTQKYAVEVFNFFKENNWNYDFSPVCSNNEYDFHLTPESYVEYYKTVLELFLSQKGNKIKIRTISNNILSFLTGTASDLCCNQLNCAEEFISITPDGNIYNCNRFADYKNESFGNLNFETLESIISSNNRYKFYERQKYIEKKCGSCEYFKICNGGCPHSDYVISKDLNSKEYECKINKGIYTSIESNLRKELCAIKNRVSQIN